MSNQRRGIKCASRIGIRRKSECLVSLTGDKMEKRKWLQQLSGVWRARKAAHSDEDDDIAL